MIKNITRLIILTIFLMMTKFNISVIAAEKESLAINAKSALLMEQDTGTILFDKNSHEKLPPASMTKIMTLLLVMEALEKGDISLTDEVTVSERASSMGGSQVFLATGEKITVENLIKAVAIASGNDASVALAETIAGSEEAFVQQMNEKVAELNLKNTNFKNSSGLPADNHYSTAYDMAVISQELLKYEHITNYTSIYDDYLRKGEKNEFWLVNTNKLVRFYDGVDGLKTGYTREAKYCLAATAKRDDMRVIAVVMGSDDVKERNRTITDMLDYAFNHFSTEKIVHKNDVITTIQNIQAKPQKIQLIAADGASILHEKGTQVENVTKTIETFEEMILPIEPGETIGKMTIKRQDEIIKEIPLTVQNRIDQASLMTLIKRSLQKTTLPE